MNNISPISHKQAMLTSFFKLSKYKLQLLNSKKYKLINESIKKSDVSELEKIRQEISNS